MLKQEIKNCFFYGVPTYGDGGVKPVGTISEHQPMMVMMLMTVMVMMMIVSSGTARDWGSGWWRRLLEAQRAGFLQLGAREASSRSNSDEPRSPSNGAERPRPRPEGQDRNLRVKIAISGTLPLQCSKGQYRFCRLLLLYSFYG